MIVFLKTFLRNTEAELGIFQFHCQLFRAQLTLFHCMTRNDPLLMLGFESYCSGDEISLHLQDLHCKSAGTTVIHPAGTEKFKKKCFENIT